MLHKIDNNARPPSSHGTLHPLGNPEILKKCITVHQRDKKFQTLGQSLEFLKYVKGTYINETLDLRNCRSAALNNTQQICFCVWCLCSSDLAVSVCLLSCLFDS